MDVSVLSPTMEQVCKITCFFKNWKNKKYEEVIPNKIEKISVKSETVVEQNIKCNTIMEKQEYLSLARANQDHIPSPYDSLSLSFKKGI